MEYIAKIKFGDSFELTSEKQDEAMPYLDSVILSEATSVSDAMSIGGTAANALTFDMYNQPVSSLDGVKLVLSCKKNVATIAMETDEANFEVTDDIESLDALLDTLTGNEATSDTDDITEIDENSLEALEAALKFSVDDDELSEDENTTSYPNGSKRTFLYNIQT